MYEKQSNMWEYQWSCGILCPLEGFSLLLDNISSSHERGPNSAKISLVVGIRKPMAVHASNGRVAKSMVPLDQVNHHFSPWKCHVAGILHFQKHPTVKTRKNCWSIHSSDNDTGNALTAMRCESPKTPHQTMVDHRSALLECLYNGVLIWLK